MKLELEGGKRKEVRPRAQAVLLPITYLFSTTTLYLGGGSCRDDTSKSNSAANELGLANVGGVFVVLMGGMGVACVVAVFEFLWKSRKVATEERVS